MKPALFVVALSLLLVIGAGAQDGAFDPSGNYHPVSRPTGDDQFVQINLRLRRKGGTVSAAGEVRNTGRWNRFSTTDVNQKRIGFRTATLNGVRYEFDGKFVGSGNFRRQWPGAGIVMLKGSLLKYVGGRRVQDLTTDFVFYPLH